MVELSENTFWPDALVIDQGENMEELGWEYLYIFSHCLLDKIGTCQELTIIKSELKMVKCEFKMAQCRLKMVNVNSKWLNVNSEW